jgi:hypothetical protein
MYLTVAANGLGLGDVAVFCVSVAPTLVLLVIKGKMFNEYSSAAILPSPC